MFYISKQLSLFKLKKNIYIGVCVCVVMLVFCLFVYCPVSQQQLLYSYPRRHQNKHK